MPDFEFKRTFRFSKESLRHLTNLLTEFILSTLSTTFLFSLARISFHFFLICWWVSWREDSWLNKVLKFVNNHNENLYKKLSIPDSLPGILPEQSIVGGAVHQHLLQLPILSLHQDVPKVCLIQLRPPLPGGIIPSPAHI